MLINLSDVSSNENKVLQIKSDIEMNSICFRFGVFDIVNRTPVDISVKNSGYRKIKLEAKGKLTVAIPCDRCLEPVNTEFILDFTKEIDFNQSETDRINDLDESNYMDGYELDVDKLIYSEILLLWPMKTLCSEHCKGVCNKCGINLNTGTCDCDTTVLDPRMAAIRDIFDNFKQ